MNPIEIIRAACIKTNPEIETRRIDFEDEDTGADTWIQDDTIRLADVLLAIGANGFVVSGTGQFYTGDPAKFGQPHWNLRKDNLSEQSPETLTFLAGLLNTK